MSKYVNLEGFGLPATRPEQAPGRYARWLDELRDPPGLKPYASFAALADRLQVTNKRLSRDKAEFLARHWGHEENGSVVLLGDPAHKIVNPMLYQYEEVREVWKQAGMPVLWVDAADSELLKRIGLSAEQHAERRAAFRDLRHATLADAGHMLHHDQPEKLAELIENFLR